MVRRLSLGKNNHLTYASLALNPRNKGIRKNGLVLMVKSVMARKKETIFRMCFNPGPAEPRYALPLQTM